MLGMKKVQQIVDAPKQAFGVALLALMVAIAALFLGLANHGS